MKKCSPEGGILPHPDQDNHQRNNQVYQDLYSPDGLELGRKHAQVALLPCAAAVSARKAIRTTAKTIRFMVNSI